MLAVVDVGICAQVADTTQDTPPGSHRERRTGLGGSTSRLALS